MHNLLHACMGSPALSTFIKALDAGFLDSVPLMAWQVRKSPPNSEAMGKGHLDLTRANQRSTKTTRRMFMSVVTVMATDNDSSDSHRPGTILLRHYRQVYRPILSGQQLHSRRVRP